MSQQWQEGSESFLKLTIREQYLILLTGLVAIFFIIFYLFIDSKMTSNTSATKKIAQLNSSNQSAKIVVLELQAGLQQDPNKDVREKITQYEAKLAKIDTKLLTLTSDLISPVQMRYALLDLLKLKETVSLLSFELLGAEPLLSPLEPSTEAKSGFTTIESSTSTAPSDENMTSLNLYRHGIKIKLSGRYFDLRDYLIQLEKLPWKLFWQDFNFKLVEYPNSELEIELYSLGTNKEFVGV
jgi:MSHA biogenesis protein MshJ